MITDEGVRPSFGMLLIQSMPMIAGTLLLLAGILGPVLFFVFHLNVFDMDKPFPPPGSYQYGEASRMYLVVGPVLAIIGAISATWAYFTVNHLAVDGVIVAGKVTQVGSVSYRGMKNITYRYSVGRENCEQRASVANALVEKYEQNGLRVLADPKKPSRHMIL